MLEVFIEAEMVLVGDFALTMISLGGSDPFERHQIEIMSYHAKNQVHNSVISYGAFVV